MEEEITSTHVDVAHRGPRSLKSTAGSRVHQQIGLEPATEQVSRQRRGDGSDSVATVDRILPRERDCDVEILLRGLPVTSPHRTSVPDRWEIRIEGLLKLEAKPLDQPHPFRSHGEVDRDSIGVFGQLRRGIHHQAPDLGL